MADTLKHTNVDGKEHVSRAKDPAIVAESQKPVGWLSSIPRLIATAIILISLAFWLRSCRTEKVDSAKDTNTAAVTPPPAPVITQPVEALVLEHECFTPCSTNIAWKFKIRTEGHPLLITFQGVQDPVLYPGEGDFQAPSGMRSGETKFESPNEQQFRVQVYKRILVQGDSRPTSR